MKYILCQIWRPRNLLHISGPCIQDILPWTRLYYPLLQWKGNFRFAIMILTRGNLQCLLSIQMAASPNLGGPPAKLGRTLYICRERGWHLKRTCNRGLISIHYGRGSLPCMFGLWLLRYFFFHVSHITYVVARIVTEVCTQTFLWEVYMNIVAL